MTKKTNTLDKRSYLLGFSDGLELKRKEKCEWDYSIGIVVDRQGNIDTEIYNVTVYDTDCGIKHTQREILTKSFKFCPYCGKRIEEVKE